MPDRDVFDRNVKPGWQTASRYNFAGDFDSRAGQAVLRALGQEIQHSGMPGIVSIVDVMMDESVQLDRMEARKIAIRKLQIVRSQHQCRNTDTAVESAKSLLAYADWSQPESVSSENACRLRIVCNILADLAVACLSPAQLLAELQLDGISSLALIQRRELVRQRILEAPETVRIAEQVIADPSGDLVKVPRFKRLRLTQAELLSFPLT